MDSDDLITIGTITGPHGVDGRVRVFPLTDFPERWKTLGTVLVGTAPQAVPVQWCGFQGRMVLLALAGVKDRGTAERLRGLDLRIPRQQVHPLPPDTFYIFQLQGLNVLDTEGNQLGRVLDVETNPANDLLVVQLVAGGEARIPMIKPFLAGVDLIEQRITIRVIPGLLE